MSENVEMQTSSNVELSDFKTIRRLNASTIMPLWMKKATNAVHGMGMTVNLRPRRGASLRLASMQS